MNAPIRVLLIGADGRMGKAIVAAAESDPSLTIVSANRESALGPSMKDCNVVIDFSATEATAAVCEACAEHNRPLVLGTTGHNAAEKDLVRRAAKKIPVVMAANFSPGVNTLFALVRQATALLGKDFDAEIVEAHHRTKKDAPSGTAKRLAEIIEEARRDSGSDVPVHSLRAGDIVGDHQIVFAGRGERLELTHRATSRETFARGALRAARWAMGQSPGFYNMENVIGLSATE